MNQIKHLSNKNISIKYYFLLILVFVVIILNIFISKTHGISPDSLNYFEMSENFQLTNLFPFGYPFLLKASNLFGNLFISSKVLAFVSLGFMVFCSIKFDFYPKETILVIALKTFIIFHFSWSETIFLPLFYLLILSFYLLSKGVLNKNKFAIISVLLLTFLFLIKYSALFIFLGISFFLLIEILKKTQFAAENKYLFFKILIITAFLYATYLLYNHFIFNNFLGTRLPPKDFGDTSRLIRIIAYNFFNAINPFYSDTSFQLFGKNFLNILNFGSVIIGLPLLVYFFKAYRYFRKSENTFLNYIYIIGLVYFFGVFYSNLTTKIDGLDFRLMLPFIFIIHFITIKYFLKRYSKAENILFFVAIISLATNSITQYL